MEKTKPNHPLLNYRSTSVAQHWFTESGEVDKIVEVMISHAQEITATISTHLTLY